MDLQTAPAAAPPPPTVEAFRLKFTGDGGVYFGVWLVNLLLMIVTLGLYTPFARRRTVKYFYAHTVVAGSPLEFTGGIKRMFLGFLIFFGLYVAYSIASHTEQDMAAGLLALSWVAFTPWLWASAMRFRSANTRWRGIRGQFTATTGEAYAASWPLLALVALGAVVGFGVALLRPRPSVPLAVLAGVAVWLAMLALLIRLEFNYARLRFQRSAFGGQTGRWKASYGDFLRFTAVAFCVFLGIAAVLIGLLVVVALGAGVSLAALNMGGKERGAAIVFIVVLILAGSFLVGYLAFGPALAWREARKFALIWNTAGLGQVARFRCDLRPWPFVRLRIRNMLLTLLTGGFFRPFAVTSEYRMKLESVTLHVKGGLDQLAGQLARQQGALGDAVADAVGFDMVG